jgi:bromodomain-containing protein 8
MSSTRSSRGGVANLEVVSHLSARERLLVAQAVYEYGANAWHDISKVLSKHPLINRPKGFFSPQVLFCSATYMMLFV